MGLEVETDGQRVLGVVAELVDGGIGIVVEEHLNEDRRVVGSNIDCRNLFLSGINFHSLNLYS